MADTHVTVSVPAALSIPSELLGAAMLSMANEDVRFYLNGLLVEVIGAQGFIVSTDGHTLFAARFTAPESFDGLRCIIPAALLKMLPKPRRGGIGRLFIGAGQTYTFTFKDGRVLTTGLDVDLTAKLIDGRFPDWRAVIPTSVSGEPADYNPAFLARLSAIAKRLGTNYPRLQQNGQGCGLCLLSADACFAVMPWRTGDKPTGTPAWVKAPTQEPAHA